MPRIRRPASRCRRTRVWIWPGRTTWCAAVAANQVVRPGQIHTRVRRQRDAGRRIRGIVVVVAVSGEDGGERGGPTRRYRVAEPQASYIARSALQPLVGREVARGEIRVGGVQ